MASRVTGVTALALFLLVLGACSATAQDSSSPTELAEVELAPFNHDLSLQSRGEWVRYVHDYLFKVGYFPNAELAQQYPAWRPIVSQAPADWDVFDERSIEAVRRFQMNMGITPTGVVDQPTRDLLQQGRCGIPDGITVEDPSNKFALRAPKWGKSTLTYRIANTIAPFTIDQLKNTAAGAFRAWSNQTTLRFLFTTNATADITIQFGPLDGRQWFVNSRGLCVRTTGGPLVAQTPFTLSEPAGNMPSQTIILEQDTGWNIGPPVKSCTMELQSVLEHEIGHALGLRHSTESAAIMSPGIAKQTIKEVLTVDDDIGISTRYDTYQALPGAPNARDLAVGKDGSLWIVNSNFQVDKWNGFCCFDHSDGFAVRLAVDPNGKPYVVNSSGEIYRHSTNQATNGLWQKLPSPDPTQGTGATDIGIGYNGDVWIISDKPHPAGSGYFIYKMWETSSGITWVQDHSNGAATRITVGPQGTPWVLDSLFNFYRYTNDPGCGLDCLTNDPVLGLWEQIPGLSSDLAIGPGGTLAPFSSDQKDEGFLWSLGGPVGGNLVSLAVWNEQRFPTAPAIDPPGHFEWGPPGGIRPATFGPNSNVAVGPTGNVFFIDGNGQVWTSAL